MKETLEKFNLELNRLKSLRLDVKNKVALYVSVTTDYGRVNIPKKQAVKSINRSIEHYASRISHISNQL